MSIPYIHLFLSALISIIFHVFATKLFPSIGLLDFPERYGLTRARLPYPLGIVTACLLASAILLFGSALTVDPLLLFCVLVILGAVCAMDDRFGLPSSLRLAVQAVLALTLFMGGTRIYTLQNPLEADGILSLDQLTIDVPMFGLLPVWSGIVTILWLLLTTNAMNWFDGISGQVSTLSIISFLTLGLLSLSPTVAQPQVAILCFVLAGISIGSLFVTFPPAKGILGDTGAMAIGLLIGVLAMSAGGKVATAFLVLGVPLTDSILVIARRLMKRSSLSKGNAKDEHLHHRLLTKGWSERQVIALTAALSIAFGGSALLFTTVGKLISGVVLFLVMVGLSYYSRPKA